MFQNQHKMNAKEAEKILFQSGFELVRQSGSHRIYIKGNQRIVIPFHSGKELHPKIVKELKKVSDE